MRDVTVVYIKWSIKNIFQSCAIISTELTSGIGHKKNTSKQWFRKHIVFHYCISFNIRNWPKEYI